MMIVDVLDSFIANVDCTLKIKSQTFSANPDTVTLYVENTLFARQGTMINFDNIVDLPIDSVNHADKSIVVLTNIVPTSVYLIGPPAFVHGTPYAINQQLDKEVSYPFVYLLEVVRERIPEIDSRFSTIPTLRLFFLDEANFRDWDSDELYSLAVTPQRIWCDYVLAKIRGSKLFGYPANIEITSFSKFGQYVDSKGSINSLFNKTLSGVELRMDLPFVAASCCNC